MGGGLCGCIPPPPEGGSVLHRKKDYEQPLPKEKYDAYRKEYEERMEKIKEEIKEEKACF